MYNVKKDIKRMATQLGKQEAVRLLVIEGVNYRVAEKLAAGTYTSEPKANRDKLVKVLKEHGFYSSDEKAS